MLLLKEFFSSRALPKLIGLLVLGGMMYLVLLAGVFLPSYFVLPSQIRSLVYHSGRQVASVFRTFSELQLQHGVTCNQDRVVCIKSLILTGEIIPEDEDRFHQLFAEIRRKHPDTKTICFNSPGGHTSAAAAIAKEIKQSEFATCVGDWSITDEQLQFPLPRFTSRCESACAMLVLAGSRRISVGNRFLVGFHAAKTIVESKDPGMENTYPKAEGRGNVQDWGVYLSPLAHKDIVKSYEGSLSVAAEEMNHILEEMSYTPYSKMYFPSIEELEKLRFFTERASVANFDGALQFRTGHISPKAVRA